MTIFPSLRWRRTTPQGGLWALFAWFGRSCDQVAGILLNPLVVAVFARSVERDPFRISWIVAGFGLGWLLGASVTPLLQHITIRVIPWIVGGYIVRTAAIVLMTIAVMSQNSSSDQRFKSVLICYVAYAIATGIARTAQARHMMHGSRHQLWNPQAPVATISLAACIAIGAWAMWSTMSHPDLTWSASFGRVWILAAVALGVATLAAIQEGMDTPELPSAQTSTRPDITQAARHPLSIAMTIAITGIAALSFVEVVAFLLLFTEFRRQTLYLRGGLAFFAVGWAIGIIISRALQQRHGPSILAQAAIGFGAIGLVIALAASELTHAAWMPETIRGHVVVAILMNAVGLSIGLGISMRRSAISTMLEGEFAPERGMRLAGSVLACLAPLPVGWVASTYDSDWVLIGGVVLALAVLAMLGLSGGSIPVRPPSQPSARAMRRAILSRS